MADNSTEGFWMVDTCSLGIDAGALTWVPTTPGGPAPAPSVVARSALSRAPWPVIQVTVNPPAERLLVNFPVWLHVASGWQAINASASVAGVSARVTAQPRSVRWEMGDGHTVTCTGPGTAYDPNRSWQANVQRRDCGYTYRQSSARQTTGQFRVRVTIRYAVTWTSNAGGGGSLGSYDRSFVFWTRVGQLESLED